MNGRNQAEMSQIQVDQVVPAKKRRTRRKRATGGQTADGLCPVCTPYTSEADAKVDTKHLVSVVLQTAQMISGITFYPYQVTPAARLVESVLLHEGSTVTALFSRQSGKTEMVAAILAAMAILLPVFANDPEFERDWRFNLTDDQGRYRGFKNGISVGIYAPKLEQAQIQFRRLMKDLKTQAAKEILEDLGIECDTWNRDTVRLSNGSEIRACSASEQSKVEGSTHDILALEEAQDISSRKIKKSLRPMIAATKGTTMAVGTATIQKGEFHHMIKSNMERRLQGGKQDHFEYNWLTAAAYNSLYGDFVKQEMEHYGADSDEFRMSYLCLSGDTEVFLADGTTKRLETVRAGDVVWSHTGKPRPVTFVKNQGIQETVTVEFFGTDPVTCTPDHRFFTDQGWIRADELTKDHRLLLPVPARKCSVVEVPIEKKPGKKRNTKAKEIPNTLSLTAEAGELLGWFVAEGYCNTANKSQVTFYLSAQEPREAARIKDLLEIVFGLDAKIRKAGPCLTITSNCTDLNTFLLKSFGHTAPKKRLPAWFFQAPEDFLESFLLALWSGDGGYFLKKGSLTGGMTTASPFLWRQVDFLLRTFGVLPSAYSHDIDRDEICGRNVNAGTMYQLWVYGLASPNVLDKKRSKRMMSHLEDGYLVRRFKALKDGPVERTWDLEVDDEHSFCLPSAAVHNCEWVLERGQFVTPDQLFAPIVCVKNGRYSLLGKADANLYQAAGIDFGKGQSSTVVTVVEVDWDDPTICQSVESFSSDGNAYFEAYTKSIIDWLEIQGDNYEIQFSAIVDYLLRIPNLQKISVDATGLGAVLLDRFITEIGDRVEVEGVVLTAPKKSESYKIFHTDIVSGRFKFPAGPDAQKDRRWKRFVHQMLDLQKSYTGDLMKCHCPDEKSARDDYCDSAMLANLAANTPPVGSMVEVHQENFLFA